MVMADIQEDLVTREEVEVATTKEVVVAILVETKEVVEAMEIVAMAETLVRAIFDHALLSTINEIF